MKFLCDRCKTRYSIGDERVRGKILKIRCKNCANVITVREGMAEPQPSEHRRHRPTTASPPAYYSSPTGNGALGAAFANQVAKPPPALEEEWYVSIDGEQSGPFSLADAQRWVAARPFDAELYCWSEGFDDWLPVDKVSHFRGLRKRPQAPPPMPRAPARLEDPDPKPLFAATMATLERSSGSSGAVTLPPVAKAPAAKSVPVPVPIAQPMSARTNGAPAIPVAAKAKATGPGQAIPRITPSTATLPKPSGSHRAPATGVPVAVSAKAVASAFDVDQGDGMTAVDAPTFGDEMEARAEQGSAKYKDRLDAAIAAAGRDVIPEPQLYTQPVDLDAVEDNLDIGEVSRVVKLADLVQSSPTQRPSRPALAAMRATGRATGSAPKIDLPPLLSADGAPLTDAAPGESMMVANAPVALASRRGMMMLLGGAALLLLGVVGAVILILASGDNDTLPMGLGHSSQIDTSRPEDLVRHTGPTDSGSGSNQSSTNRTAPVRHSAPWGLSPGIRVNNEPESSDPTKTAIKADEVEDMAQKRNDGTQRCWMRAQKGALGFDLANLKKIMVTMSIDRDGSVTEVGLSEHAGDTFGKCLIGQIKSWKFRTSPKGGTYMFALAFSSG